LQKHRDVLQQASRLAVAVALCIAAMLAVYALTGHFTNAVLLGALIGFVMAMGNFLSLSITVSNAMNRAPPPVALRSARQHDLPRPDRHLHQRAIFHTNHPLIYEFS